MNNSINHRFQPAIIALAAMMVLTPAQAQSWGFKVGDIGFHYNPEPKPARVVRIVPPRRVWYAPPAVRVRPVVIASPAPIVPVRRAVAVVVPRD